MNKSIKHVLLALLLHITTAYGMENNVVISTNTEFTANGIFIPNDVLKNIFKYLYSSNVTIDDFDNVNDIAKMTQEMRSVCKNWHHTYDPVEIRKKLNWKPDQIASFFNATSASLGEKYNRYITFLASTLKDQPNVIDLHTIICLGHTRNAKIALAHGVNPNQEKNHRTALTYALQKNNREIFTLLLDHGAHINRSLLFTALCKSRFLLSIYLGPIPPTAGLITYILACDPLEIQSNLPAKYVCTIIAFITFFHLSGPCLFVDQWPLTTLLKYYWKKLTTLNKS